MSEITNPQERLDHHFFTAELKKAGFSSADLTGLSFGKTDGWPFSHWPIKCHVDTPAWPLLLKPYCALKWLLLEDPPWSRDRDEAYTLVAEVAASPLIDAGLRSNEAQRARARNRRVKMPDDGKPMAEVVGDVARRYPDLTTKELWPHFLSELNQRELSAVERVSLRNPQKMLVEYSLGEKRRTIGMDRFANLVSAARRDKKSRQPG